MAPNMTVTDGAARCPNRFFEALFANGMQTLERERAESTTPPARGHSHRIAIAAFQKRLDHNSAGVKVSDGRRIARCTEKIAIVTEDDPTRLPVCLRATRPGP